MREIVTISGPSSTFLDNLRRSEIEPVVVVNIMTGERWVVEPVMNE